MLITEKKDNSRIQEYLLTLKYRYDKLREMLMKVLPRQSYGGFQITRYEVTISG